MVCNHLQIRVLRDRVDAVEEIRTSPSDRLATLRGLLKGLPDLATGLCRIQYGKVSALDEYHFYIQRKPG